MAHVWEAAALREGLISIGDVWRHQGKQPAPRLVVTSTPDGAVIHPASEPAPAVRPVSASACTRGRTLHIGPGVALTEVGEFVGSLPEDIRPANYTVSSGATT